jgi:hypothetical protein
MPGKGLLELRENCLRLQTAMGEQAIAAARPLRIVERRTGRLLATDLESSMMAARMCVMLRGIEKLDCLRYLLR